MDQILILEEDQLFHSRDLHLCSEITLTPSVYEEVSLLETQDFGAIIPRDGACPGDSSENLRTADIFSLRTV